MTTAKKTGLKEPSATPVWWRVTSYMIDKGPGNSKTIDLASDKAAEKRGAYVINARLYIEAREIAKQHFHADAAEVVCVAAIPKDGCRQIVKLADKSTAAVAPQA